MLSDGSWPITRRSLISLLLVHLGGPSWLEIFNITLKVSAFNRATRSQGTYGEYKCMSERVVADLKDHLGSIDQRLDALRAQNSTDSDTGTDDIS